MLKTHFCKKNFIKIAKKEKFFFTFANNIQWGIDSNRKQRGLETIKDVKRIKISK